jgi:hypothetical protein
VLQKIGNMAYRLVVWKYGLVSIIKSKLPQFYEMFLIQTSKRSYEMNKNAFKRNIG